MRTHPTPLLPVIFLAMASNLWAQPSPPHLGYVYPAGGRQGTTFQVKIGGRSLEGTTNVYVSGAGIQATVGAYDKPLPQKEVNTLRERLQELQKQGRDAGTLKEMAEIREKLAGALKKNANPALAETVTVEIAVAPEAPLGTRELRLLTPLGLSNPLVFCIGQLPETCENETRAAGTGYTETVVTLPVTVNGRIVPTDTSKLPFPARQGQQFKNANADRYRFAARQGQQLVVVVSARELIPYLADAVPGWFQAVVTLYDTKGREVAYDDDYRFHPDPVLHYAIPQDGEYILEIKDAIYRGREDFVYRITLGALPFVTNIFPLGGPADKQTTVEIKGWNLPVNKLTIDTRPEADRGGFPFGVPRLRGSDWSFPPEGGTPNRTPQFLNSVPFAVDTLPECVEKESNDMPRSAQPVTLPVIINGRIDKSGDTDVFRFEGHAGEQIVAEVYARRLDSPLDSVLRLTDATGRQLAFNDDHEDKGAGLNTHHADSYLRTTLPADGSYYVLLGDAQHNGGPEYAYRLRLSTPRPDFELRVVPSSINTGAGQTVPLTVYALRQDGFSGDIALALKNAPRGFTLSGALVPAHQDQIQLTLTTLSLPGNGPLSLALEGHATIGGKEIIRPAVPADDMMQAFAYRHLVPAQDLRVMVLRRGGRTPIRILSDLPVRIPVGGTVQVRAALPANRSFDKILFELSEPSEGISLQSESSDSTGTAFTLRADAAKLKPGLRGNLIVSLFGERTPPAGAGKAKTNRQRIPLGTLPAIPFEIVP